MQIMIYVLTDKQTNINHNFPTLLLSYTTYIIRLASLYYIVFNNVCVITINKYYKLNLKCIYTNTDTIQCNYYKKMLIVQPLSEYRYRTHFI